MKIDMNGLMQTLAYIDECYMTYSNDRLMHDLTIALLFMDAAMRIAKADIDLNEAKVMLDLNAFNFIYDQPFINEIICQAMSYVSSTKYLPQHYIEQEYVVPLNNLKDFLLSSSTQVAYNHGTRIEEIPYCN